MKLTAKALILASAFSAIGTTTVVAMEAEANMLTGAVVRELTLRGLPTDGVLDLSIAEILALKNIFANSDSNSEMTGQARSILENASK